MRRVRPAPAAARGRSASARTKTQPAKSSPKRSRPRRLNSKQRTNPRATARTASERTSLQQSAAEAELRELEGRAARRSAAYAVLSNIEPNSEPWTWESAQELLLRLEAEYDALRVSDRRLTLEREAALREAAECETQGGSFHPELLRLRDELDAELLVQRFDEIEAERAGELEARLGPLLNALVVSDPEAVAKKLAGRPRELESVWLVAADAQFLETAVDPAAHDVVVVHGFGSRITRLPAKPMPRTAGPSRARREPAPRSRKHRDSLG